jgi:hypothetical protein
LAFIQAETGIIVAVLRCAIKRCAYVTAQYGAYRDLCNPLSSRQPVHDGASGGRMMLRATGECWRQVNEIGEVRLRPDEF